MDTSPIIAGVGNPNLDCIIKVDNDSFLKNYNLKIDGQQETTVKLITSIKEDAKKSDYNILSCAGGVEQNTLRIFQQLIDRNLSTVMFGAIGNDNEGKLLIEQLNNSGVISKYTILPEYRTSNVLVIVYKDTRTAIACIGAASKYDIVHIGKDELRILKSSKFILFSGFFAFHSPHVYSYILEQLEAKNIITFNIAGTYIFKNNGGHIIQNFCKISDIVIGNKEEFSKLCEYSDLIAADMKDLMKSFHKLMLASLKPKKIKSEWFVRTINKLLIVTDNKNSIFCVFGNESEILIYNPTQLAESEIVDTTGAGDAFLAGVLYGLYHNMELKTCLEIGNKISIKIIKQLGVIMQEKCDLTL